MNLFEDRIDGYSAGFPDVSTDNLKKLKPDLVTPVENGFVAIDAGNDTPEKDQTTINSGINRLDEWWSPIGQP